jgi:hypothetical protein
MHFCAFLTKRQTVINKGGTDFRKSYVGYEKYQRKVCDVRSAEAWQTLVTKEEGTEIFIKWFTVIENKREFPREWKLH